MESLTEIASLSTADLNEDITEKIYNILIKTSVEDVPKNILRKIYEITISVLKFKGNQVSILQEQSDSKSFGDGKDDDTNERILDENERLSRLISKLETEKTAFKSKMREMSDEIITLQKKLHEISAESDKDSSDPLSELDRQAELLKNISTKNKHIKRLIRDIENLQLQNIEQSQTIIDLENKIQLIKSDILSVKNQLSVCYSENKELNNTINELTSEITRLEGNITYLEDEREKADIELKDFIEKLEERARSWRNIIDGKENQLDLLKEKYEILKSENPKITIESEAQNNQFDKLVEAVHERDGLIAELENKLKSMAEEMITSTRLMNQISAERETEKISAIKKNKSCCRLIEDSLILSQKRCKELSDMMEKIEEDNLFKSKQVIDAINTLDAYEKGEDGLKNSLSKIAKLERKLNSRDKHIKALVMELNSLHEISQENTILRKKLNIPDDVVISTTNLIAKQRNKDKMLERSNLKLRASEEIRLQLKLETSELKKEIIELRKKLSSTSKQKDEFVKIRDQSLEGIRNEIYCDNCLKNIQKLPNKDTIIKDVVKEWEEKYSNVIEENENLRVGMHEILERIREYEVSSDHITIDCSILEKVLHALDARSISGWYHPAMRMQNELIAVKEREHALKEKINLVEKVAVAGIGGSGGNDIEIATTKETTDEINRHSSATFSVSSKNSNENLEEVNKSLENLTKFNSPLDQNHEDFIVQLFPMIIEQGLDQDNIKKEFSKIFEKNRELVIENETLITYKLQYIDMVENLKTSESDITKYCSNLVESLTDLEIKFNIQNKKYEFLKEEYNQTLNDYKLTETKNISLITELKKEINNKKHELNLIKLVENKKIHKSNNNELITLRKNYAHLEYQMADLIGKIFNGQIPEFVFQESYSVVGIIKENIQLDYLTYEEYENIKNTNNILKETNDEMILKCQHLENSLNITQDQVKLQQKLISEITDNHIELRHLVADLQSTSEEKFLISKSHRDLELAKKEIAKLLSDKEVLEENIDNLKDTIKKTNIKIECMNNNIDLRNINNELKLRFIKNYIFTIQSKYCKYTPLISLTEFVSSYSKFLNKSNDENKNQKKFNKRIDDLFSSKLEKTSIESRELIKLVKYEIKCDYLEEQLLICQQNLERSQKDLDELRISVLENNEQWKTIQILFSDEKNEKLETVTKFVQTEIQIVIEMKDSGTNTDPISETSPKVKYNSSPKKSPIKTVSQKEGKLDLPSAEVLSSNDYLNEIKTLQSQLKEEKQLASERNISILETDNKLSEATGRIIEMEKVIKSLNEMLRSDNQGAGPKASDMIETTINSLQSLISEKESRLNDYQNLLKAEKDQHIKSTENYEKELDTFKKIQKEYESTINLKNVEIDNLKMKIETKSFKNSQQSDKLDLQHDQEFDGNCDNSLNEISDEKIEEMFMDESKNLTHHSVIESEDSSPIRQTNDIKNHFKFWEKSMKAKDEEIALLKEKLNLQQGRERIEASENPEIDQLRIMLEEKDKHINDLMETLTSFHDDQQRFLSETSLYSVDQVTQLGSDLTRSVTTNKILQTQIDALKRQLASLTQREKQARDLANTLKNQLIKRPVVSIKTELNSRTKTEQQQKRIVQLELELVDAKKEIGKQQSALDAKRAKNASEVSLWEKQKRYQQNAEKLKMKLEDTEKSLERTRNLLTSARNTITRLEKEKHSIEAKVKAATLNTCCRTPSCPNLFMSKYSLFESPDNQTPGYNSDSCSSQQSIRKISLDHSDIINQLKSQLDTQQRRIYAYELVSHGSNAVTTEIEKLQEKLSTAESQNIRWEAKNLQLQLDNDLLRQGNENDRMKKQIKHLEDYIVALKEELAQAEAEKELPIDKKSTISGNGEQTILALKRIVEKLKVENKNLKEGRSYYQCSENKNREQAREMSKLQHSYAEALDKISALQIELQLKNNSLHYNKEMGGGDLMNEFKFVKEQLIKKSQLLEKAKVLLTRAAAKEKSLKEQIILWKRKCSELQNVPVIDEISE